MYRLALIPIDAMSSDCWCPAQYTFVEHLAASRMLPGHYYLSVYQTPPPPCLPRLMMRLSATLSPPSHVRPRPHASIHIHNRYTKAEPPLSYCPVVDWSAATGCGTGDGSTVQQAIQAIPAGTERNLAMDENAVQLLKLIEGL